MGYNSRLNPECVASGPLTSVASGATSSLLPIFVAATSGELVGARFVTSASLSTNWSLNIYKTSSAAGSRAATTGSQAVLAAGAAVTISLNGAAANLRFVASDIYILELVNQGGTTTGAQLFLDTIYGRETGAVPAAATGPA